MASSNGKLKKSLNLTDLFLLGMGSIIGSGWLFAAQNGANTAGSWVFVSWMIGAVLIILVGLVYAELGAAIPEAGGFVRYPDYTHGSLAGFLIGFFCLLAYSAVIATEVEAVRHYAQYWWPALQGTGGGPSALGYGFQLVLILVFFLLNYWSVKVFGKTNTVITIIKFVVPGLIIVALLPHVQISNFKTAGADPGGVRGIFEAVTGSGIAYAFNGFRNPIEFAGEARRPQRDVPIAIILSVVVGLVLYALLQFVFIGAVPADALSGGWSQVHFDSPWAGLAAALSMGWLVNLVLLDSVISPSATGNIYFSSASRSLLAWARNGTFYRVFQRVGAKTGVPRPALWLVLVMAIGWMTPARFQDWSGIIAASTSAKALTFVVGPVSLIVFRKRLPQMERPFLLKGAEIVAPLAFIAATFIIYWSEWRVVSILVPIVAPALIFYFAFVDRNPEFRGKVRGDVYSALWLLGYFVFMLAISFVGSYGPAAGRWIASPWDTILAAAGSLVFYYWGIATALPEPRIMLDDHFGEFDNTKICADEWRARRTSLIVAKN